MLLICVARWLYDMPLLFMLHSLYPSLFKEINKLNRRTEIYTARDVIDILKSGLAYLLTLYEHIKSAEQRTIIQQYGDWYTGRWWVSCDIRYIEEGPGRAGAPPSFLLAVPNVTAHPSTASVPTSSLFDVAL